MQLTWAGNYESYGSYRAFGKVQINHEYQEPRINRTSQHYWADPRDRVGRVVQKPQPWFPRFDPSLIDNSPFNACDSGAHYWVSKNIGSGYININRVCDQGLTTDAVGRVSVLVNGGGYGFGERQAYAPYIHRFLGDEVKVSISETFEVLYGRKNHAVYIDFTPQRP